MNDIALVLFVAGRNSPAEAAAERVRRACVARTLPPCHLTVVDVSAYAAVAGAERVFVTPTLLRRQPLPEQRVVGDLSDPERVLAGLGLAAPAPASQHD
jgi:circadian clock protein KaiB